MRNVAIAMKCIVYSATPLLRNPLLRELHYYANIQKTRILCFFIFVKKNLATIANFVLREFATTSVFADHPFVLSS